MKSKPRNRLPNFLSLDHFGISSEDIVESFLRCDPQSIEQLVIVTPFWGVTPFQDHAEAIVTITENLVWKIKYKDKNISVIRTGIGAPQTGDIILTLGCTPCEVLVFTGSAGALDPRMNIGDIIIAESSLSGDGFSRFLSREIIPSDRFLSVAEPDNKLTKLLKKVAEEACFNHSVSLYSSIVFSIDSMLTQFFRMRSFVDNYNCSAIEMETAAVFNAAHLVKIRTAAVLQVSDIPILEKSIFKGRTKEENISRHKVRKEILSKIILDMLSYDSILKGLTRH